MFTVIVIETARPFTARPRFIRHPRVGSVFSWFRFAVRFFPMSLEPETVTTVFVDATEPEEEVKVSTRPLSEADEERWSGR